MIRVVKSGLYTTVQDMGRFHYRNKGVPVSGAMDAEAAQKANSLLENDLNAAVLEITMTGPTLQFEEETYIAMAGANMSVTLNNTPIKNYKVYKVAMGDVLSYGRLMYGFRGYLALKDGITVPRVLGSRSYFKSITAKYQVMDGDFLPFGSTVHFEPRISEIKVHPYWEDTILEAYRAPEYHTLPKAAVKQLFDRDFSVSKDNNRMAYQLKENLMGHNGSMLTAATLPGTVQWTPAGKLIVLMKDGQTTGGYPRILQLTDTAMAIMAQKKTGDKLSFKLKEDLA